MPESESGVLPIGRHRRIFFVFPATTIAAVDAHPLLPTSQMADAMTDTMLAEAFDSAVFADQITP